MKEKHRVDKHREGNTDSMCPRVAFSHLILLSKQFKAITHMYLIFSSVGLFSSYLFEDNTHQRHANSARYQPLALWHIQPIKMVHLNKS